MSTGKKTVRSLKIAGFAKAGFLSNTESTNADAQKLLTGQPLSARSTLKDLSLLATDDQRAGRGRLDRRWVAPAGSALCTSFIVRPHASQPALRSEALRWLTMLTALAAQQTLADYGVDAGIKWPNDVVVAGQKIAGILAQLVIEPEGQMSAIVGIGLNTNMGASQLPLETATSMALETGHNFKNIEVLEKLAHYFYCYYRDFVAVAGDATVPLTHGVSVLDALRSRTVTLGEEVAVHLPGGEIATGKAVDLADNGEIMVRDARGNVASYAAGDVVHLRLAS